MSTKTASYEQKIMAILQNLPDRRIKQVLDFVQFMEIQEGSSEFIDAENEADVQADNARWNAAFAASPSKLRALAQQAREEIRSGQTTEMIFTADGRIVSG